MPNNTDCKKKKRKLTRVYRTHKIEKDTTKKNNPKKSTKRNKGKNNYKFVVGATTAVSLVLLMVIAGEVMLIDNQNSNKIARGATLNGVEIGGLEVSEAKAKLVSAFSKKADDFNLRLNYKDKSWNITAKDFEVNTDIHLILEEAYLRGTNSTNDIKRTNIDKIVRSGDSINVAFNYVFLGLDERIEEILETIEIKPIDSEVLFNSRSKTKFTITEGEVGYTVDRERLYEEINSQFNTTNDININLELVKTEPKITREDNELITKLRASFSTNVSDSTGARKDNVRIALAKLDGLKVNPGETVSFNYLTGPHTIDNGYKVATIIYKGRFTDGVGGGVCQASTTLYNALLLAGIQVDEVNKHTLPVKYVPLALDAMVSEYISDLKFTNNLDSPIFISSYCDSEKAYVDIYGVDMGNVEYKTRSKTIRTIPHGADSIMVDTSKEYTDHVLFKGEYYRLSYPKDGAEVKAYLEKYVDGKLVEDSLIRHEIYQPQNGIVIEGSEEAPKNLTPIDMNVNINR